MLAGYEYMTYVCNVLLQEDSYSILPDDPTKKYQCIANELDNEIK